MSSQLARFLYYNGHQHLSSPNGVNGNALLPHTGEQATAPNPSMTVIIQCGKCCSILTDSYNQQITVQKELNLITIKEVIAERLLRGNEIVVADASESQDAPPIYDAGSRFRRLACIFCDQIVARSYTLANGPYKELLQDRVSFEADRIKLHELGSGRQLIAQYGHRHSSSQGSIQPPMTPGPGHRPQLHPQGSPMQGHQQGSPMAASAASPGFGRATPGPALVSGAPTLMAGHVVSMVEFDKVRMAVMRLGEKVRSLETTVAHLQQSNNHGNSATSSAAGHQRHDSDGRPLPSSSGASAQRSSVQSQPEPPNKRRRMASLPATARRVTEAELASAELEEHPDLVSASGSRSHARSLAEGYYSASNRGSRAATPARSRSRSRARSVAATADNSSATNEETAVTTTTQAAQSGAPRPRGRPPGRRNSAAGSTSTTPQVSGESSTDSIATSIRTNARRRSVSASRPPERETEADDGDDPTLATTASNTLLNSAILPSTPQVGDSSAYVEIPQSNASAQRPPTSKGSSTPAAKPRRSSTVPVPSGVNASAAEPLTVSDSTTDSPSTSIDSVVVKRGPGRPRKYPRPSEIGNGTQQQQSSPQVQRQQSSPQVQRQQSSPQVQRQAASTSTSTSASAPRDAAGSAKQLEWPSTPPLRTTTASAASPPPAPSVPVAASRQPDSPTMVEKETPVKRKRGRPSKASLQAALASPQRQQAGNKAPPPPPPPSRPQQSTWKSGVSGRSGESTGDELDAF
ncbi:unnamed protein product [Sympodiomycopsis kandeliae]